MKSNKNIYLCKITNNDIFFFFPKIYLFLLISSFIIALFPTNSRLQGFVYFIVITPGVLIIFFSILWVLLKFKVEKWTVVVLIGSICSAILIFGITSSSHLFTFFSSFFVIAISWENKNTLSVVWLNYIAIILVIIGFFSAIIGINEYGAIPGQTTTNLHQGLWWRIGLFPSKSPPYTGFFGLILFISNYLSNKRKFRYCFLILAIYLIVFSGSRTMLIGFFYVLLLLLFRKSKILIRMKPGFFAFTLVMVVTILILFNPIILSVINYESPLINSLLFRDTTYLQANNGQNSRAIIMQSYLKEIKPYWISGAGDQTIDKLIPEIPGTSEMRILSIVFSGGIFSVFFFFLFLYMTIWKKDIRLEMFGGVYLIIMFYYGSFMHVYTFPFLSLLFVLYVKSDQSKFTE